MAGEEDILIPVALSRRIHEGIPGSEWATTKGGHGCVWEHPAESTGLTSTLSSAQKGLAMATIPRAAKSRQSLEHGQLGLFGVDLLPGVAQVTRRSTFFHHRADGQPRRGSAADPPDFNGGHGGHG